MSTKKVNPKQQQPAQTDAGDEIILRRRRLLKGAAAAPMVMTLFSGAAVARTSTAVTEAQELAEAVDDPLNDPPLCVVDDDGFDPIPGKLNKYYVGPSYGTHVLDPPGSSVNIDPQDTETLFKFYQDQCQGDGGIIITASSATSLTQ